MALSLTVLHNDHPLALPERLTEALLEYRAGEYLRRKPACTFAAYLTIKRGCLWATDGKDPAQ